MPETSINDVFCNYPRGLWWGSPRGTQWKRRDGTSSNGRNSPTSVLLAIPSKYPLTWGEERIRLSATIWAYRGRAANGSTLVVSTLIP